MSATLKDRITYERSFGLGERIERAKDKLCLHLARHWVPVRLAKWVIVKAHADKTSGDTHPGTVSAFDIYPK